MERKIVKNLQLVILDFWIMMVVFNACDLDPNSQKDEDQKIIISGSVILNPVQNNSNVAIVLDELGVGTVSDSVGHFSFSIADTSFSVDTLFTIYFYLQEFMMEKREFKISEKEIQLNKYDVIQDGTIKPVTLNQVIKVEAWTDSTSYHLGSIMRLDGKITSLVDSTIVVKIEDPQGFPAPAFGYCSISNKNYDHGINYFYIYPSNCAVNLTELFLTFPEKNFSRTLESLYWIPYSNTCSSLSYDLKPGTYKVLIYPKIVGFNEYYQLPTSLSNYLYDGYPEQKHGSEPRSPHANKFLIPTITIN